MENVNTRRFSSFDLLHNDGSGSVPFPHTCAVEITDSLAEKFKMEIQ
jgi:hypothetical protein